MFLNLLCLIACLLCCLLMSYFWGVVLWLGICVEAECRQNYYLPPPLSLPLSIFRYPQFFHKWQLSVWNQGALKAGFGAVKQFSFIYWSPSEKFSGEHHVKLWDETKLLRFTESASSNIVLYSRFIWLIGSITLIRAETERHDIVCFSKVTTKSLASGTGS